MTASIFPAALTPLFVAAAAAWLELGSLVQGLAVAGGGRGVRAAGTSETLMMITFGGGCAAFVCAVAWIADRFRSQDWSESHSSASITVRILSIALVVLLASVLIAHFVIAHQLVQTPGMRPIPTRVAVVFASMAGLGGIASMGWLILSRRRASLQIDRMRGVLSAFAAVASGLIAYVSSHFTAIYAAIAVHG